MGFFKSIGQKISKGARFIGKKALVGLDYGIQGLKKATDIADKYTLGLDHFIPYYSALKAGIDVSDNIRKIIKGEEKLNATSLINMGLDVAQGAMSLHGGKAELQGLEGGYKMFKRARMTGSSLGEASKIAGGRVIRGYGLHKEQLKDMGRQGIRGIANVAKAVRKGDPVAIAKTAGGISAGVGAIELKKQSNIEMAQEGQENTNPTPMVNNIPQKTLPVPPPVIHPLMKQAPLVYTDTGIYMNGKLVG